MPSVKISPDRLPQKLTFDRFIYCATVAVIAWYIFVCLVNYFFQRPLWNDEDCVFQSIKAFHFQEMFGQNLIALQVFPRVYLFLIQSLSRPFHFHLLALRFLPFVCMMAAFFLWLKIASYELKNKVAFLTFALSWCASAVLIYYSGELKQYSMDVLTGALFLFFIYNREELQKKEKSSRYRLILVLLPVLILFSYVAAFFFIFPLYHLVLSVRKDKNAVTSLILYCVSLFFFSSLSYFFDMRYRPTSILNREFNDYFVSLISVPEFFKTLGEGTNNLFSRWFVERPKILKEIGLFFVSFGFLYMFGGFFSKIKKNKYRLDSLDAIAFVIFMELFIMGVFRKYLFTVPRTSLFFCPIVLYLTVKGISWVRSLNRYLYGGIHVLYFIYLIFLTVELAGVTFTGNLTFRPILW